MPIRVRHARVAEAALLSALCFRSKAAWGYDAGFMAQAEAALRVDATEIARGDVWMAIAADGGIIGVVSLAPTRCPGTLDLSTLFIEPGRLRTGVGRVLLGYAIAEARRRGARRLTISSDPNAAGFYERLGARLIGEAPSDAIPGRMLPLYEIALDQFSA